MLQIFFLTTPTSLYIYYLTYTHKGNLQHETGICNIKENLQHEKKRFSRICNILTGFCNIKPPFFYEKQVTIAYFFTLKRLYLSLFNMIIFVYSYSTATFLSFYCRNSIRSPPPSTQIVTF